MTTILLTGIPGSKKTDLVQITHALSDEYYEKNVGTLSFGRIVAEEAFRIFRTDAARIFELDFSHQQALRSYAIARASYELTKRRGKHTIVETPMSMFLGGSTPDIIFDADQINQLHEAAAGINYVVTVIDDPLTIRERLRDTPYPNDPDKLLDWITVEVQTSGHVTPSFYIQNGIRVPTRTLVVPWKHSEETLVKLLNDAHPTFCYFGYPITKIKEIADEERRSEFRARIDHFRKKLQEYAVVVSPIEIQDARLGDPQEQVATVNRDLNWFVQNADLMVAYFPTDCESSGVFEELRHAKRLGKVTILIHPNPKHQKGVFNFKPTLYYQSEEEFFNVLNGCRGAQYDHKPEAFLRRLLDDRQDVSRYAHLRPFSVAVDIVNEDGKHLLCLQPETKELAGKWMLVAGKRKPKEGCLDGRLETAYEALERETFEEVGLHLTGISEGYRIYPVDYGEISYVRVYTAEGIGTPSPDHAVKKREIEKTEWFTVTAILCAHQHIAGATLAYSRDMAKSQEGLK